MKKLICSVFLVAAATGTHAQQTWQAGVMTDNEGVYAGVTNDSGAILGRYCTFKDDSCVWMLVNDMGCKPANQYPALATAKTSAHVSLVCAGLNPARTQHRYFLKPYDTVDGLVGEGGVLGVAMVAESGNFRVFRFDLRGAKAILEQADAIYRNRLRTKDQTL
jgi:hypothetical protein